MSRALHVSDETIEALAQQQGTTPEQLAERLLKERLAEREALLRQNAERAAGLDDALARAARHENPRYDSLDAFVAALDAIPPEDTGE